MVAMKIPSFGGMIPAQDPHLLPDTAAELAQNTWVYSGSLIGLAEPVEVHTCATTSIAKVYRIPNNYADSEHLSDAAWLEFENLDTDVIRAPVVGDAFERYYWASPSGAPRYNTVTRIRNGDPSYLLGIPTPGTPAAVTPTGGTSGINVTRAYVYTWVSSFGEEGPPSPPVIVTGQTDATWNVVLTAPTVGEQANRSLSGVRIYRTITSVLGVATYYLVTEQPFSDTTYSDTLLDSAIVGGTSLPSAGWTAPPSDLEGWVSMPNGIVAAWKGSEIWFSEPYRPHAWPASYALTVEYPIVGLGVIGQTLIVCTTGFPTAVTGVNPNSMSQSRIATFEPCLSRGSILSTPEGVYYASHNGLVLVGNGQVQNITREVIDRDNWLGLTNIATLRAARLGTAYYAYGSSRPGVFEATAFDIPGRYAATDFSGSYRGLLIDPMQPRIGVHTLTDEVPCDNVMNDPWSASVLILRGGKVYSLDLSRTLPKYEPFVWRSKIFETPVITNMSAVRVNFEVPASVTGQSNVPDDTLVQTLSSDQFGLFRLYADGVLVATRELRGSGDLFRLPSGYKASFWQIEIEARCRILSIQMASSVKELARA